jgi:hypothetical protein
MAKLLYLLALGTALVMQPLAAAQAGNSASRVTPVAGVTEARQNQPATPATPSPVAASARSTTAGGAAKNPDRLPEESFATEAANSAANSELQALIQNAMGKQAALSAETVNVSVTAEGIELKGSVSSSRERLTADRLAHSYAGSRKVINHIVITERPGTGPPQ